MKKTSQDDDIDLLQKSKSIDGCLKYFFRIFFMSTIQAFFSLAFILFISYLTIIVDYQQLFKCSILCLTTPLRHLVSARNDERMNSDFFLKYFYARIVQLNLCWKIHNKYVFRVNIHIYVLKYLVQIQIIQNFRRR